MNFPQSDVTSAIQLALAPAFLLTAVVGLISAVNIRVARAVDRMRFLHGELLSVEKLSPALESHYRIEYREVQMRGQLCALAIFFNVLSGILISLTVLELFFRTGITSPLQSRIVVWTFVTGLVFLMTAMCIVLIEVIYAQRSTGWNLPLDPKEKS
jgi:hypothetical protein